MVVRPALPNGALSSFNSDLVREPLAGHAYECPVGPEATIWVTSRRAAVAGLLRIGDVAAGALGPQRPVNGHALALSIAEIVAAMGRVDPAAAGARPLSPQPDDRGAVRPLAARLLVRRAPTRSVWSAKPRSTP